MKARITLVLLLALGLWPMAQHLLVRRFDVNPWKLFGWAMYARPRLSSEVRALDDRGRPLPSSPEVERFRQKWALLGRLASPALAGRAVFAAHPELQEVTLSALLLEVSPKDGIIEAREDRFELSRCDAGACIDRVETRRHRRPPHVRPK